MTRSERIEAAARALVEMSAELGCPDHWDCPPGCVYVRTVEELRAALSEEEGGPTWTQREVELLAERAILTADLSTARERGEALAGALKDIEWAQKTTSLRNGGTTYTATTCPACGGEKDPPPDKGQRGHRDPPPEAGHKEGCALRAALRAWEEGR